MSRRIAKILALAIGIGFGFESLVRARLDAWGKGRSLCVWAR